MKKLIRYLSAFIAVFLVLVPSVQGRETVDILRIRTIPNPAPGRIEGEEVLEVTFSLLRQQWIPAVGWSLRYYDQDRELLGSSNRAYFQSSENNSHLFKGNHFKGGNVFVALFPLRPDAVHLVFALGGPAERKVLLYPYTGLLEEFKVLESELDDEMARSDYVILED
ncbi:MAG: hypothetical protein RAO92_05700 [Candidatus Euphemobacter frigidus]|nr:hypothetical protein [Candidatus Euphemobacter frigidus]MDP8275878.1 hypothetical protein [Candidatus Euphemobacter frigidus]